MRFDDGIPERYPAEERIWRKIRRARRRYEVARRTECTDYPFLIRCLDRPEWGAVTVEWAAERAGERRACIVAEYANEGRKPLHGLRFHRDGYPYKPVPRENCQPVLCVETGQEFPSVKEASEWLGAKSASGVSESLRLGISAGGFHFYRKGEEPPPAKVVKRYNAKAVVCVETGKRYDAIGEAAKAAGTSHPNVHNALKYGHSAAGFHFRFAGRALVLTKAKRSAMTRDMRIGMKCERRRRERRTREEQAA